MATRTKNAGRSRMVKWIVTILVIFLVAYVGSYFALSRYSAGLVAKVGGFGFYYCPVSVDRLCESPAWQKVHHVGIVFYYPIFLLDHHVFGGPYYAHLPMMGISAPAAEGGNTKEARANLELAYDAQAHALTIELQNTGQVPLHVDNELVFMVEIAVADAKGDGLRMAIADSVDAPPASEFQKRFLSLKPGESITRRVLLKDGFKVFTYGHSVGDGHASIAASEILCAFRELTVPSKIWVRYRERSFMSYRRCFRAYTGLDLAEAGIYAGPLEETLEVRAR